VSASDIDSSSSYLELSTLREPANPQAAIFRGPGCSREEFSKFVSEKAIYLFKCGLGRHTRGDKQIGCTMYYDSTVAKVTLWIISVLPSVQPRERRMCLAVVDPDLVLVAHEEESHDASF
jgi:hypothetical protein